MSKIVKFFKWVKDQVVSVLRDCPSPLLMPGLGFLALGIAIVILGIVMAVYTQNYQMLVLMVVGVCVIWYGRFWLTGFRRGVIVEHKVVCIVSAYRRRGGNTICVVFKDLDTEEQYTHNIYGKLPCPYLERGKYTIYMQAGSNNTVLAHSE